MSTDPKPSLPPPAAVSQERIAAGLAALAELTLTQRSSPGPAATGAPGAVTPKPDGSESGDPAIGTAAPAPVEDPPALKSAREAIRQRIDSELGAHTINARIARLVLADAGVEIGISDEGAPSIRLKDGTEVPINRESLRAAGISSDIFKPTGKPGTGIVEIGGGVPPEDIVERGLRDQHFFNQNRRQVLDAMQRQKGRL